MPMTAQEAFWRWILTWSAIGLGLLIAVAAVAGVIALALKKRDD